MSPRLTHEQFLERANIKHGKDRYIYKSKYKTAKEKMEIECPVCKTTFYQEAYSHLSGCGCPKCSKVNSAKKRTKTHEQFVEEANAVHGEGTYIYNKPYVGVYEVLEIWCTRCEKTFEQIPHSHLGGRGCSDCARVNRAKNKTKTHEQFVEEANAVHGEGRYIYNKPYVLGHELLEIWCTVCKNPFEQKPNGHLGGRGCRQCGIVSAATKKIKQHEQFVEEAIAVHGEGRYIYNKSYVSARELLEIWCTVCEETFEQTPSSHINNGCGCPKCGIRIFSLKKTKTHEQFVEEANAIHNGKYTYDDPYVAGRTPIKMGCFKCKKIFLQAPSNHLQGQGCPYCRESKLEKRLTQILEELGYKSHPQHRYEDCKNKRPLPFDSAILEKGKPDILIEMDGIQHFQTREHFGGIESHRERIKHDTIKNKFCLENDKILVRISYLDIEKIETLIKQAIKNRDEGIYDIIYSDPHLYQTAYFPTWKAYVCVITLQRKYKQYCLSRQ